MARDRSTPPPPAECANCGADIPPRAKACPACGADERTGWRETDLYDGLDLPSEAWTDNDDDEPSPSARRPRRPGEIAWYWQAAALIVLLYLAIAWLT